MIESGLIGLAGIALIELSRRIVSRR